MGYRSDVSVVFYTRNTEEVPFAAIKFWFDENYPRKEATEEWGAEISVGPYWVMVTYQNVKWYEDYAHVQAVRKVLDSFDECFDSGDSDRAAWEMVEVGEQMDDIRRPFGRWRYHSAARVTSERSCRTTETRSNYCDYLLGVRREIVFG